MGFVKSLKRYKPWVGLVMACLILGSLIHDLLDENLIKKLLALPNLWAILFLAPLMLFCKALSWHYLTKGLSIPLKLKQTFESFALSNLGRYIPGKVFFVLGRVQAYGPDKQRIGTASFGMFVEFIIELGANFLILFVCCLLSSHLSSYRLILIPVSLIACFLSLYPQTYRFLYQRLKRRFPTWVNSGHISWNLTLRPIGLVLLKWFCFMGCIYIFIQAWQPVSFSDCFYIAVCLGFSSIIGSLAVITPGGLGVREGVFTACLLSIGMKAEDAWTVASLTRVCQWYGELTYSVITLGISGLHKPKEACEEPRP